MVKKTIFAASSDETRHVLNGVFWSAKKGQLEMVATSGIWSPLRWAFLSRISMGSRPSASAARLIWDSAQKRD